MADPAVITEAVQVLRRDPALPKPALVLEAGCGSTSDVYLPFETKVAGMDIDAEQLKHNDRIEIKIQGDLQTYELPQGEFDIVACVDGGHSYEYAMADSLTARRLLAPGGIIMWHDYPTYPGVWVCLEELSKKWPGKFRWVDGTALVIWKSD